jgi:LysM repeat protein
LETIRARATTWPSSSIYKALLMNIQQLATLLINQASTPPGTPSNMIQLSDATLQRTGVSALITQYLRRNDGVLYLSVDYTKIPSNPPESGFSLNATVPTQSGKDFLSLSGRNAVISFVPVGNDVGFTVDVDLTTAGNNTVSWVFSDSFSDLQGMPFDALDITAPHFVFATDDISSYSPGLYYYSGLSLTGFFADVATLIGGSSSSTALLSDGSSNGSSDAGEGKSVESSTASYSLTEPTVYGDTGYKMTGTLTPTEPGLEVVLECDLNVPTLSLGNVITLENLFVGTSVTYFQSSSDTNGDGESTNGSDDDDDKWQRLIQAYLRATVKLENSSGTEMPLDLRLILPVGGGFGNMTFVVLPGSQFATSIGNLGSLVVGQDWSSLFGGSSSTMLQCLDTFGLKSATVNFSLKNFSVTSVFIDAGTLTDWTLWGNNKLALDVGWMILLGTTTTQNVTVSAFFTFSTITFDISLSIPDLIITGTEKGMISYSLSDLNEQVFGGALSIPDNLLNIEVSFGNFNTTIDIPSKTFNINAQASASFTLFNTQILAIKACTIAVTVAAATDSYNYTANINGILALGPIEAQVDATLSNQSDCIFTMHLVDETIGSMLNHIVHLVDPTFDISFPDPWDKLLDISLDAFVVEINATKGSLKLSYDASIDLVFININSISLLYQQAQNQQASSVQVQVSGTFLGQPFGTGDTPPLGWDPINEQPPAVPGKGSSLFDLQYAGLGQHIAFKGVELTRVEDVMKALRQSVIPSQAGQLPPFGQNSLAFSAQSNWLIGAQFSVMDTVAISAIFNDPNLYGILIALSGAKAQIFAGLSFEILYRKVTDTIGVYHIELKLPDAMRNLQFGEVSITLPIIVLDIYTNGNFRVDFGFPKGLDFSNSFSLQVFPFVGYGGFYFALLDGATSTRVPQITNGNFSPVVEFGVALSIGVGKTINEGILSGGISVTVVGILQGVLAWFNPTDVAPKETYYWFQGTISIVGKLYATINFAIIQASVDVTAYASVTLTIESHQPIYIALSAGVSVRVSVKIVFFTIHLSFKATINASFTIGHASPTPWQVASGSSNQNSQQPQLYGQQTLHSTTPRYSLQFRALRQVRVMMALSAPPTNWPAVCVMPQGQQTVAVWALPAFTKSEMWAIASSGAVRASGTATITTTTTHDLDVGDAVTIAGVSDSSFDGTFQVASVPTGTTFTYQQAGQGDSTSGSGSVTAGESAGGADAILLLAAENSIAPNAATLTEHRMLFGSAPEAAPFNLLMQAMLGWAIYVENSGAGVSIATQGNSGAVRAGGTTTITTTTAHGFNQGDTVIVSGVSDNSFNGFFTIASVPSATTFTYAQTGASNSTSGGGNAGEASVTADQLEDLQQQLQNPDVVAAAFDYGTLTSFLAQNFTFNVTPSTDANSETGVAMFPMIPGIKLTDNAGTNVSFSNFNQVSTNYQQMVQAYFQLLQVQFQSRNSGNGNNTQEELAVEDNLLSMATIIFSQYFNMLMSSGVKAASDLLASYPYQTTGAMSISDVGSAIGDYGLVSDPMRIVSPNQDQGVLSTGVFIPLPGVVHQILATDTLANIATSFQSQGAFNQSLEPYSINDLMAANLGTTGIFNPGASVQFTNLNYTTQQNDTLNLIIVRLQLRTAGTTAYSSITGLSTAVEALQRLNPGITNPNQQVAVSIASTGAVRGGGISTITTTAPHGLAVNGTVNVQGVSDSTFNGQFTIASVPNPTTFTYEQSNEPASASGGGTAGLLSITLAVSIEQNGGAVRASGTATITTTAPHGFALGDLVAISGVTDTTFNGTFQVASLPSATSFTCVQEGQDSTSGGGAVTSAAFSSAQGSTYSVVAGDTLNLIAAYFLALTQNTVNLSVNLSALLELNTNLTVKDPAQPQPVNTPVVLPPVTLSMPAGASIYSLATTLITTVDVIEASLEAVPTTTALLAPQGVMNLPLQYKTSSGDSFSGIASKFNLTLNVIADQCAGVDQLFADNQPLVIIDLASISVQTLMNDLLNQTEWNNASGMVSRFLLSGLRLPDPNDTYFQSLNISDLQDPTKLARIRTKPLFKLTGQQYPLPTIAPGSYQITMTNSAGASWLNFGGAGSATFGLTTGQQDLLNTVETTQLAPGIQTLSRLALFQMTPPRIALQNHIAWQATVPPVMCSSSSQPATGNPVLWTFPDSLVTQLDQLTAPALYELVVATHQDPSQPVTVNQAGCYAWATIVDFTISLPVTDGSASSISNAYIIEGADDTGAALLQEVYNSIAVGSSQIASNGAVRASGIATITTTAAHELNAGDTVNVQGVTDSTFNGQFTIASVPTSTTFTYAQTGASNSTSGGGTTTAVLATLYLLYSPNPTSANPSGLSSDQINADSTYLLKTNLSTLTHSGNNLAAMIAPPDPTSVYAAPLSDPANFVALLWEASVTRSGGFYLNYVNQNGGAGLPASVFGSSSTATLSLVVLLKSQAETVDSSIQSFNNCVAVGGNIDTTVSTLFVQPATYTVQPNDCLQSVQTNFNKDWETSFALQDIAGFNQGVPQVLQVGAPLAIPGQAVPYNIEYGDTMSSIIKHFNNNFDLNALITAGSNATAAILQPGAELTIPNQNQPYTIEYGDTLVSLAATYTSGNLDTLLAAGNNLSTTILVAGAPLAIPGQATLYTIGENDTITSIVNQFNTTVDALIAAGSNSTSPILTAGAQMQFADNILLPSTTVPSGTVGFEITRVNPDPNNLPFDNLTPQQIVNSLFNLVGFSIAEEGVFTASGAGLPTTPADSSQAQSDGLTPRNVDDSNDPNWYYEQTLAVSPFGNPQYGSASAGLPPANNNPYNGVGYNTGTNQINEVTINLNLQDIYGNIQPLPNQYSSIEIPVGYYDNIVSLGSWPSLAISYLVTGNTPTIDFNMTMQQARYIPSASVSVDSALQAIAADLESYASIYYQLVQPDFSFSLQTTLDSNSMSSASAAYPLSASPFYSFAYGAYIYLAALSTMQAVYVTADGSTTSVLGLMNEYGPTAPQLFEENQDQRYSILFGEVMLSVPLMYSTIAGDSLASIATKFTSTATAIATANNTVPLNPGNDLWAPDRTAPVMPPSSTIAASPAGAARVGGTSTITTSTPHGFAQDDLVSVSGVTDTSFNGVFTVASVPSPTTLTYQQSNQPDSTSGAGTVGPPAASPVDSGGAVRAGGTSTITTTAAHGFNVGDMIVVSGMTDTSFNGLFQVAAVTSATSFTYLQFGLSDSTSGGGTASLPTPSLNAVAQTAHASVAALAEANAALTNILQQGVVLTVGTQSYQLGENDSFNNAAQKLNATVGAVATANQWLQGLLVAGATLTVKDVLVGANDTLSSLAFTYAGGDLDTFATNNASVPNLFPSATSVQVGTNSSPVPPGPDDTLTTFASANKVTVDQLALANATNSVLFAAGAKIEIPGVMTNTSSEQYCTYTAGQQDTLQGIANKFNVQPADIAALNPDIPGLLNSSQTIKDTTSGKSVQTSTGDTFNSIIARFQSIGVTVSLSQLASDVAGQSDLVLQYSLWICPSMIGGANGQNANLTLSGLATAYNTDVLTLATANAAAIGFLAPNISFVLWGVSIQTNDNETLNGLVNYVTEKGVTISGAAVTVADVASAVADVKNLINQTARVVPIPPPSPVGNSVQIKPSFSDAVFQITVNLITSRNPQWVDPDFTDVSSVSTSLYKVSPEPDQQSSGNSSLGLTQFASDLQNSINGLYVATGEPIAEGDPASANTIWGVNFGSSYGPQINYQFNGSDTQYFAIPPLSTSLMGGTVDITPYVSGQSPPFTGTAQQQTFQAVDLDVWLNTFLQAVDTFLSPAYAIPAYGIDPADGVNEVKAVVNVVEQKQTIAQAISQRLLYILQDQNGGSQPDAVYAIQQAMLAQLSSAFTVDTIMQVPVTVTSPFDSTQGASAPRLSGKIIMNSTGDTLESTESEQTNLPSAFSFSTAKVSLTNTVEGSSPTATFLFSVKAPADYKEASLNLQYVITELELPDPNSVIGSYEGSSWLKFILPLESSGSDIGPVNIPIPLRSYPSPVTLVTQTAEQSVSEPEGATDLLGWNFDFVYQHEDAEQDTPLVAVTFNAPQSAPQSQAPPPTDPIIQQVFSALAQFMAVYPTLQNDLSQLTQVAPGTSNSTALAAAQAFSQLVTRVAEAWSNAMALEAYTPQLETYYYQMQKQQTEDLNPTLTTLTITSFDLDKGKTTENPTVLWPSVVAQLNGTRKLLAQGAQTNTSAEYTYPPGIPADTQLTQYFVFGSSIAASPAGAVRASGVTTITTTTPHGLNSGNTVVISGVADNTFNGLYTVASVVSPTVFTYAQTGEPDSTSGGGTAGDLPQTDTSTLSAPQLFSFTLNAGNFNILSQQNGRAGVSITRNLSLLSDSSILTNPKFVYQTPLTNFTSNATPSVFADQPMLIGSAPTAIAEALGTFLQTLLTSENNQWQDGDTLTVRFSAGYSYALATSTEGESTLPVLNALVPILLVPSFSFNPTLDWQWPDYNGQANANTFVTQVQAAIDFWQSNNTPSENSGSYLFSLTIYASQGQLQPLIQATSLQYDLKGS